MTPLYLTTVYFRTYAQEMQKQHKKTRCQITGSTKQLSVHHITAYKELLLQAFEIAGVTYKKKIHDIPREEQSKVITALHTLHTPDKVITVTKSLHDLYHQTYQEVNRETWDAFVASRKKRPHIKRRK